MIVLASPQSNLSDRMGVVGNIKSPGVKTLLVPVYRHCGICGRKTLCRWLDTEMRVLLCKGCTVDDLWVDAFLNSVEGYRRPRPNDAASKDL